MEWGTKGLRPNLSRNEEGLRLVREAIEVAGYAPGKEVSIALDVAAQNSSMAQTT